VGRRRDRQDRPVWYQRLSNTSKRLGHAVATSAEEPVRALGRLVRSGWSSIERYQGLLAVSSHVPPSRHRAHHAGVLARIERLDARGQAAGEFRSDLPTAWLVTVCYSLFHAAANEVRDGCPRYGETGRRGGARRPDRGG